MKPVQSDEGKSGFSKTVRIHLLWKQKDPKPQIIRRFHFGLTKLTCYKQLDVCWQHVLIVRLIKHKPNIQMAQCGFLLPQLLNTVFIWIHVVSTRSNEQTQCRLTPASKNIQTGFEAQTENEWTQTDLASGVNRATKVTVDEVRMLKSGFVSVSIRSWIHRV